MRIVTIVLSLLILSTGTLFTVPAVNQSHLILAATPDFTIAANPANLTITAGSSVTSTITLTSINFNGTVTLSTTSPPPGFSASLSPSVVALAPNRTAVATLTVSGNANATTSFDLRVTGSSGALTHFTTVHVTARLFLAPDYSISAPSSITINQGSAISATVIVSSLNNFAGTVSLTPNALPHFSNGPLLTLSPTQVSVTPGSAAVSTLTVTTSSSTPVGPYNYTIAGSASSGGGFINHTFVGQLVIKAAGSPDFSISANPTNQTVVAGSSAKSLIILTSLNGFSGTVNLSTSPPPLCASCPGWGLNSSSVKLSSGGTASSTLTFVSTLGTPPRSWLVVVSGTSGTLSHNVTVAFTVRSSSPPPDFTITANPTSLSIPAGSTATSTITLSSVNGFSGTISLQTSPSPACPSPQCSVWSISPTVVNLPPNGTATSTLTIMAGTQGGAGNITVTGTNSTLSRSVVVAFKVTLAQPDFTVTANPSQILTQPGFNATSTITVTALNGFSGTVFFSLSSSPGLLANIIPHNVTGTGSATLIVSASTPGNYTSTVTGTSGSLSHSVTILVNVVSQSKPDFAINANPTNITIAAGSSGSSVITLTSLNNFNGTITLTDTVSSSGIFATLSSTSIPLPPGGSGSSVLTIAVASSTPSGSYFVTVTGTSGSVSHSTFVFVSVTSTGPPPNFSLSANPLGLIITRGLSGTSTINVTSLNNFSGTVSLTSTSTPLGLTTSLNPSSINLVGGGTANSILTISTSSGTGTGNYTVAVAGTSGNLTRVVTIFVTVTAPLPPPDFSITISPTSQSMSRGSSTSFAISVRGTNGFNGTVSLSASISPHLRRGPTISLPSLVGPYSNSTMTVGTSRQTSLGTYTITVTATSGSITHTATVTVTVTR